MAKVIILAEDNYEDQELWYPYQRLREAGHLPVIVGKEKKIYKSKHGYPAKAQKSLKEVSPAKYEGILIPGGYAPDKLRMYPEVRKLVKQMDDKGKVIGAICHAAWVPVSAGISKGRRMTCYQAIKDDVANSGAKYLDKEVVVDKNLVTSRMPDDLPAYMKAILKLLK